MTERNKNLHPSVYDNCLALEEDGEKLQLAWSIDLTNKEIDFQICSCDSFLKYVGLKYQAYMFSNVTVIAVTSNYSCYFLSG